MSVKTREADLCRDILLTFIALSSLMDSHDEDWPMAVASLATSSLVCTLIGRGRWIQID